MTSSGQSPSQQDEWRYSVAVWSWLITLSGFGLPMLWPRLLDIEVSRYLTVRQVLPYYFMGVACIGLILAVTALFGDPKHRKTKGHMNAGFILNAFVLLLMVYLQVTHKP